MDSLIYEFKNAWNRPNNALPQIIIINVVVYLFLVILNLFGNVDAFYDINYFIQSQFAIPSQFSEFIFRPWTILTYAFSHDLYSIRHILWNMLSLYWFGRLVVEYLGSQKLINIYVLGAIFGAVVYLLVYNLIPSLAEHQSRMIGASGATYAVTIAAATLLPDYRFHLIFIGPVKIKYIALFVLASSLIGLNGANIGGNVAHLGGALMGYVYIKQLQGGTDWGIWIMNTMNFVKSFFSKQAPMKVTNKKKKTKQPTSNNSSMATNLANQGEIDKILDKISQSGYESLTKEEKQQLFNASKN